MTLAAVEMALRVLAPIHLAGIHAAYQYDPVLGYRARPGIHLLGTTDHQQEIRVNPLGTINFQEDFAAYRTRVFAVGDSYTQGTGLPADASYPFRLDLALNLTAEGQYRPEYAVVNLGLAAYGGEQSLRTLERYAAQLGAPAFILYLGAENDAADDAMFLRGDRHRHLVDGNTRYGMLLPLLRWVSGTEIAKRARLAIARPAGDAAGTSTSAPAPSVAEQQRDVLERIMARSRGMGSVLIVSWSAAPTASYDWLKAWAGENGVAFADWHASARSVQAAVPALPLLNPHSGGHLRGWVNDLVARSFAAQIRAHAAGVKP